MSWLAPSGAIGWRGNRYRLGRASPRLLNGCRAAEGCEDGGQAAPLERTGGLLRRGWLLEKVQDLADCEGDAMPFHIRDANPDDVPALARLHVQTFNEAHRGGRSGGPTYEIRERQWREAFTVTDGSWFCFVVEDGAGDLVGFAKGT